MEQNEQRRVKVTDGAQHRTGTKRAAIKPHKVSEGPAQIIQSFLGKLKQGTLSQTFTGSTLQKNAKTIRSGFGLGSSEELYLLTDPTGTGKAGMLLYASGVRISDGRGGRVSIPWNELSRHKVAYQNGMLAIGQSGIVTRDAKTLVPLLQELQSKLSK